MKKLLAMLMLLLSATMGVSYAHEAVNCAPIKNEVTPGGIVLGGNYNGEHPASQFAIAPGERIVDGQILGGITSVTTFAGEAPVDMLKKLHDTYGYMGVAVLRPYGYSSIAGTIRGVWNGRVSIIDPVVGSLYPPKAPSNWYAVLGQVDNRTDHFAPNSLGLASAMITPTEVVMDDRYYQLINIRPDRYSIGLGSVNGKTVSYLRNATVGSLPNHTQLSVTPNSINQSAPGKGYDERPPSHMAAVCYLQSNSFCKAAWKPRTFRDLYQSREIIETALIVANSDIRACKIYSQQTTAEGVTAAIFQQWTSK